MLPKKKLRLRKLVEIKYKIFFSVKMLWTNIVPTSSMCGPEYRKYGQKNSQIWLNPAQCHNSNMKNLKLTILHCLKQINNKDYIPSIMLLFVEFLSPLVTQYHYSRLHCLLSSFCKQQKKKTEGREGTVTNIQVLLQILLANNMKWVVILARYLHNNLH